MRVTQCVGKYAETPYSSQTARIRFFSIEEVCYYLCENIHIIEPSFIEPELIEWIGRECGLNDLADELRRIYKLGMSSKIRTPMMEQNCLCRFVTTLLDYVRYISHERVQDLERFLKENSGVSDFERKMLRAAYAVRDGRYHQAFEEYMRLLESEEMTDGENQAKIYHNLGVILAYKADYAQAARMFGRAYRLSGSLESLRQYLVAQRLGLGEQDFLLFIGEHQELYADSVVVNEELEKLMEEYKESPEYITSAELHDCRTKGGSVEVIRRLREMNIEWKDEYRAAFTEG